MLWEDMVSETKVTTPVSWLRPDEVRGGFPWVH